MTEPQNPERIEYLSDEVIGFVEAQIKHPDRTYLMPSGTALHRELEEATRRDNPSWGDACRIVEKVLIETANHFLELGRAEAAKERKANLDELSRLGQEAEPPTATPDTEKCEVCGETVAYRTDTGFILHEIGGEYELVMPNGNKNIWFTEKESAIYATDVASSVWNEAQAQARYEDRSAGKANPSPPTQPDQAKKTDQNFSTSENNKETLPVPIQGEPYKDGDEMTVKLAGEDYTFPLHGNAVIAANVAAYQAGASSKDQVVEAAAGLAVKMMQAIAVGLDGAKTASRDDARAYAESASADLRNLSDRLAAALNNEQESEKENG